MRRIEDESEFRVMLRGHLRDIAHIVTFCRRSGEDPETIAEWLEGAAEELRELAHAGPVRRVNRAADGDQKPVSILA